MELVPTFRKLRVTHCILFFISYFIFFVTSQAISLDSIPNIAFANLRNQSSFYYNYEFKSDLPHNIAGKFKGHVVYPNQEEREGVTILKNKKVNIKVKARGDFQYQLSAKNKKWEVMPRGEESDIFPVIERAITIANFQLINENEQTYIYKFIPTLSFLDPTFTRKLYANLTIDKKTLLPVKILAQDSTQKISWKIEFSRYNKTKTIKFPFLTATKFTLATKKQLSKSQINLVKDILNRRLLVAGENFRLKIKNQAKTTFFMIDLEMLSSNADYRLQKGLLTSTGNLLIYPIGESTPLLSKSDIDDIRIADFEPYPKLEVTLNHSGIGKINLYLSLPNTKNSFSAFLDTTLLGTFNIDKMNFFDKLYTQVLTNRNEIMNTIAIIMGGTLTVPLRVINIESGK